MTLIPNQTHEVSQEYKELLEKAVGYKNSATAHNTRRTYNSMWKKFCAWCNRHRVQSLPAKAETIAFYLSDIAEGVSLSTIDATIAAIEKAHKESSVDIEGDPNIYKSIRKGIRREHKEKLRVKQAPALSVVDLKVAIKGLGSTTQDLRDRALLTVGYWGALRRSELASIQYEDLDFSEEGVAIVLLGSKTSDKAQKIHLSMTQDSTVCPAVALKEWLEVSGIESGPVFRSLVKGGKVSDKQLSGHSVSHIIKRVVGKDYSGHSLRRGVITETAKKGVPVHEIQKFSRHRSADMVLRYSQEATGFDSTSARVLGE